MNLYVIKLNIFYIFVITNMASAECRPCRQSPQLQETRLMALKRKFKDEEDKLVAQQKKVDDLCIKIFDPLRAALYDVLEVIKCDSLFVDHVVNLVIEYSKEGGRGFCPKHKEIFFGGCCLPCTGRQNWTLQGSAEFINNYYRVNDPEDCLVVDYWVRIYPGIASAKNARSIYCSFIHRFGRAGYKGQKLGIRGGQCYSPGHPCLE